MADPAKRYHGKPCKHCGGTLRQRSSRMCVACNRRRVSENQKRPEVRERVNARRRELAKDPEWVERRRRLQRESGDRLRQDPEWVERKRAYKHQWFQNWYATADHVAIYERQLRERRRSALKRKEARHGSLSNEG